MEVPEVQFVRPPLDGGYAQKQQLVGLLSLAVSGLVLRAAIERYTGVV